MPFEAINPPQFPTPIAPYSAAAKAGNTVYVSGVLALGEGGTVLHVGDAAAQPAPSSTPSRPRSKPPARRSPTSPSTTSS